MINLTFAFETVEEARDFLNTHFPGSRALTPGDAVKIPRSKATRTTPRPETPVESAAPVVTAAPVVAPPPLPGIMPPPAPIKAVPKAPNAPVQAVAEVNEAAVRAALREVVNTKGMKVAAEILKSYGATSVSQVKPEQYADFIKACGK